MLSNYTHKLSFLRRPVSCNKMLLLCCVIFAFAFPFQACSSNLEASSELKSQIRQSKAFQKVEQAMLKAMGLKTRPRPKRTVKVPQYLMDLYESDVEHPEWISTRFRFNNKWTSVNTVRAFHHLKGNWTLGT